ncbi:MAG: cobalamin-binding protein [Deltaproteobacteria bacterium]|nr:cobalamin-binding protein [Deltaproteobacteria bacterium]
MASAKRKQRRHGLRVIILAMSFSLGQQAYGAGWTDVKGFQIELPAAPQRIVALAPSVTEILFSLELGDRIVGVTDFSDFPPETARLPRVGSYKNISVEAVLNLDPDLVVGVADGNPLHDLDRIRDLHIPVYLVDPKTIPAMLVSIEKIGEITDRAERAGLLVAKLRKRLDCIRHLTEGLDRPLVLLQIEQNPLVTVNGDTLQSQLIELAGGRNLSAEESVRYPRYSLETVLLRQPEIIIISTMQEEARLATELDRWKRFPALPAVRDHRLYVVQSDLIARAAPRILDGLEAMFKIIHPEIPIDCGSTP